MWCNTCDLDAAPSRCFEAAVPAMRCRTCRSQGLPLEILVRLSTRALQSASNAGEQLWHSAVGSVEYKTYIGQVAREVPDIPTDLVASSALLRTHIVIGNGRNTVSRVLFWRRELTELHWVLGQIRWVLRKTRWVRVCTQLVRLRGTHWARCLKPYSPKPYSARFWHYRGVDCSRS